MCALCNVFSGETHWTDTAIGAPGSGARTHRHERLHRVALANRILKHYGLRLSDWQGSAYLLAGQTGQTAVVPNVAAVWVQADGLSKQPIDPLDELLIEVLEEN